MKRVEHLNLAKQRKRDEFYTSMKDIENEMVLYTDYFKDKTILCNCDDPTKSNFVKYFIEHFHEFGLKRLLASCYKKQDLHSTEPAVWSEYDGKNMQIHEHKGDGDFRSAEVIELLKQADVVITNPPFSLFREYIAQLLEYNKKFIIMGHMTAISCINVFRSLREGRVWFGQHNTDTKWFEVPEEYPSYHYATEKVMNGRKHIRMRSVVWFTNLKINRMFQITEFTKTYNSDTYRKYDNYNAIEVRQVLNIPKDFEGLMGVPITFLLKCDYTKFEILQIHKRLKLDGANVFTRIIIKHKHITKDEKNAIDDRAIRDNQFGKAV